MADHRPADCRNRMRDEGKLYPRSTCYVEGCGGAIGPRICDASPPQPMAVSGVHEATRLTERIETLRSILIECLRAAGGYCSTEISDEFLAKVPHEVMALRKKAGEVGLYISAMAAIREVLGEDGKVPFIDDAVACGLATARRQALEEAAQIAAEVVEENGPDIAERIRALANSPTTTEGAEDG